MGTTDWLKEKVWKYEQDPKEALELKIGDKIKTTAWSDILNENDYLEGKVHQIINQKCLDGSVFEKIYIKFDDGRTLPCIREELEVLNYPALKDN